MASQFDVPVGGHIIPFAEYVAGMQAVAYNSVASIAFLCYDVLITFGDEVRYVWPLQWTVTKVLFLVVRYWTILHQGSIFFQGLKVFQSEHSCFAWSIYQALSSIIIIASVDYILILRVYALYAKNKVVKYIVAALFIIEILCFSIGMGRALPNATFARECFILQAPPIILMGILAPIGFQSILFALTAWKFYKGVKGGGGGVAVLTLIMRDGTWAFVLLFVVLIAATIMYGTARGIYTGVIYGWQNIVFAFCGYRILLNLGKARSKSQRPLGTRTFSTGPDFAFDHAQTTNIYTTASLDLYDDRTHDYHPDDDK